LSDEERSTRSKDLNELIELMRPAVQSDGGDLELVAFDVEAGTVEVQLQGACSSCAISSSTLQGGVERILKSRLDWVTEVIGGVDESADPFESAAMGSGGYVPNGDGSGDGRIVTAVPSRPRHATAPSRPPRQAARSESSSCP